MTPSLPSKNVPKSSWLALSVLAGVIAIVFAGVVLFLAIDSKEDNYGTIDTTAEINKCRTQSLSRMKPTVIDIKLEDQI